LRKFLRHFVQCHQSAERASVLYQPVFETGRYIAACDIIVWNALAHVYDLYEVKSSTTGTDKRAKEEVFLMPAEPKRPILFASSLGHRGLPS
jgi:hypothetical protein